LADAPPVVVTRRGAIALITLNRPEHGNRLTAPLARGTAAALYAARADTGVGACVLTGAGEDFCLGGDYRGAGPTAAGREEYADALLALDAAMARLGKPLVAAVNGDAHAGGLSVVIGCDLAVAADDATLGLPEAANGLFPFIALAIVKDALPKKILFDLVYNARLMSADEARSLHVINEAVPREAVLDRALELAQRAASRRPEIVVLGRDLYYRMRGIAPADAANDARGALLAALAADESLARRED
jgi:enoyl-CoA hydratase/carnithine racemase